MEDILVFQYVKDLAKVPPDEILADTNTYSPTLRYYGERFFSEFIRRVSASKGRREEGQQATV